MSGLKSHGLIQKIPHSNRYQVTDQGLTDAMFLSAIYDRLLPTGLAELHTPLPAPIRAAARNYQQAVEHLTHNRFRRMTRTPLRTSKT